MLDDITNPGTRHEEFMREPDGVGENGASALWKLTAVMRQLAYAMSFDVVEEYTRGYGRSKEGALHTL